MVLLNMLKTTLEHIKNFFFPFLFLWGFENKISEKSKTVSNKDYPHHFDIDYSIISNRLAEEHSRAEKIDEKTSKFTLGLSLCLTVLGVAATTIAKLLPIHFLKPIIVIVLSLSSIYMLCGGIISLGSFKLMPKYGYGTIFEKEKAQNKKLATIHALVGQENINLVKQVRNEVAYLCIRTGLFFLLLSMLLVCFTLTHQAYLELKKNTEITVDDKTNSVKVLKPYYHI